VTTTGGRGDVDLSAPVAERAEGDDIVVVPDSPRSNTRGRLRTILVGVIAIVLAAAGLTAALLSHHQTESNGVRIVSHVPGTHPGHRRTIPAHVVPTTAAKKHVGATPTSSVVVPTTAGAIIGGPPPVTPPSAPTVTAPPAEPASVLRWSSTPTALTIKAGGHATFSVTVANPTGGTVTLGTPLACTPSLQQKHGAPIGAIVCEQLAEVISSHQTLTQMYTIYATDTGDASGHAIAAGAYVARVENLFSIPVTITAS
jgi:hypothetical protein